MSGKHMKDIAASFLEYGVDIITKGEVDIPIVSTIRSLSAQYHETNQRIFELKLCTFLKQLDEGGFSKDNLSKEDKEALEKFDLDLLMILSQVSNIDKAKWMAQAVLFFSEKKFDYATFERLIYVIDAFIPSDVEKIEFWYDEKQSVRKSAEIDETLANLSLLDRVYKNVVASSGELPIEYRRNALGGYLYDIIVSTK